MLPYLSRKTECSPSALLGNIWRIIQDKRQEEDKDRRIGNNWISLSLFFLHCQNTALRRKRYKLACLDSKLAWPFPYHPSTSYIRMYILYSCTCNIQLLKILPSLLNRYSQLPKIPPKLAISDLVTSFEGFKPIFPFLSFPFLTPHLAPHLPPAMVLPR